jgi:hypothetical protein
MATKIAKYDLKQLISFIDSKSVAIPEFQRGFVWKTAQVKKLFDSLVKQYPIGSFILWETNKNIDARTLNGEKLPKRKYLILDGQQRMVSIFYLCCQRKFVEPHVKDKFHETCDTRERHVIDFEKFYIDKGNAGPVLEYARDSSCKLDFKRFRRLVRSGYKFPVVTISLDNYRKAIEVFERINQAGTRISTESIFLSEAWNQHSNIGKILRTWKRQNKASITSKIDTVIFIHVFAIIRQLEGKATGNIEINIRALKRIADEIREQKESKVNDTFEEAIHSVARAIQYLKQEYEIVNLGQLPSQTMITVLSIFFYYQKRPATKVQLKELRKWFWRSSLANRYIGSGYSENISLDVKKMRGLAENNAKLKIPAAPHRIFKKMREVDMRVGRSTYRNIIKQVLWQQKPIFINNSLVSRDDVESGQHKPEDDHFFPFDYSRKGLIGQEINSILNVHFLNKDENRRKKHSLPSEWLQERIDTIGAGPKDIRRYFESQLLPFKDMRDLRRYEKAFRARGKKTRRRIFERSFRRFLYKRYRLFEQVLIRLQDGYTH